MADNYDSNGYSEDFKRNQSMGDSDQVMQDVGDTSKLNEKAGEYMRELLSEKIKIKQDKFPLSTKLIDQEVTRVQASGRIPKRDFKYVDVFREKPVKVTVKVLVPIKMHPQYNFVGKLLGPKGNTLKQLQEETMCKMAILGRGSMRDKNKETEARESLDPKYSHLSDELHVEVSALAPPAVAYARIAYALAEVKKYLVPEPTEMMRPGHMPHMMERGPRAMPPMPPPGRGRMPPGPPGRAPRMPPMAPPLARKGKVFSILDRARSAMDSYQTYEDPYGAPEPSGRGLPEPDDYYAQDRYYQDEYFDEEPPRFKSSEVGTRRLPQRPGAGGGHYRPAPYSRPQR